LPPELLNNDPAGFAWGVWHDRTPKLIAQIRDAHPYDAAQREALSVLQEEIGSGRIQPLPKRAHDADQWMRWADGHLGKRWADAPFLWSESYFFRRLLEAVRYFETGPWRYVDPFATLKEAELRAPSAEQSLSAIVDIQALPADEQVKRKLLAALWGNRADLGFRIGRNAGVAEIEAQTDLVVDHSAQLLTALRTSAEVIIVTDNAGQELLSDLIFADHLLAADPSRTLQLHVKPHPYYVSDATANDTVACIDRLSRTPASSAIAKRLIEAASVARFRINTHEFYCAPLSYDRMPDDLATQFARASLTIMKGDLNYRRLVGDRDWPPMTPFAQTTSYFPGPVAALRTLKSDVVVGLEKVTIETLDAASGQWRIDGTRAMIQLRDTRSTSG
jgi:hypothetical protein